MPEPTSPPRPTCWVLSAPGAGDQRQLLSLADALTDEVRIVPDIDGVGRVLIDRLTGAAGRGLRKARAAHDSAPWPDLVLIAGGRSVVDAQRIRTASNGRSRIIAIGRPWAAFAPLDLIVTTPQYRLPQSAEVIEIPLPLNAPPKVPDIARTLLDRAAPPGGPARVGVLLGGDSGSFRFGPRTIQRIAAELTAFARTNEVRLVVCGSPRTPPGALEALEHRLGERVVLFPFDRKVINPYPAVLADCDALAVTGDSASMLAEACLSGKPVAVLALTPRRRSRLARALGACVPGPARDALTRRGFWLPARDLPRLHAEAEARGWVRPLDQLLDGPVVTPPTLKSLLDPVLARIEDLLRT